jgi:osmoprotectant transport system permease protein
VRYAIDGWHWVTTAAHWWGTSGIFHRLLQHLWYSAMATALAIAIGLPVGLFIGHTGRGRFLAANTANVLRAVPTIGVVALIFAWRPLSVYPVLVALTILAVPPIVLNAAAGIDSVDPQARIAAVATGHTGWQVLARVEFPIALPLVLAGIRSAANQVIATATIAGFFGLGGLGVFLFSGFGTYRYQVVYGATYVIIALVLLVEAAFAALQRMVVSPGLRPTRARRRMWRAYYRPYPP